MGAAKIFWKILLRLAKKYDTIRYVDTRVAIWVYFKRINGPGIRVRIPSLSTESVAKRQRTGNVIQSSRPLYGILFAFCKA